MCKQIILVVFQINGTARTNNVQINGDPGKVVDESFDTYIDMYSQNSGAWVSVDMQRVMKIGEIEIYYEWYHTGETFSSSFRLNDFLIYLTILIFMTQL